MSTPLSEKKELTGTAYAPATIGNVGPGFDVLGATVSGLTDQITVTLITGTVSQVTVTGRNATEIPRDPAKNIAVIAALKLLAIRGIQCAVRVDLHRSLPVSGGLGGSAAAAVGAAVAAARALAVESGSVVSEIEIMEAALAGESAVSGRHLDNIAPCLYGGLCVVGSTNMMDVVRVDMPDVWWVALATPDVKLETKFARSVLSAESPRAVWVPQMAHTAGLVYGLHRGDRELVRRSLIDRYAEPARAPLIPGFSEMRAAALGHGALGVSISGAGPTVFALCDHKEAAESCAKAMQGCHAGVSVHVGKFGGLGALALGGGMGDDQ